MPRAGEKDASRGGIMDKHMRLATTLWATAALICVGCSGSVEPDSGDLADENTATPANAAETTEEVNQGLLFANWFWTLDNSYGWSWKVSWSGYYRRWIWNWCYGINSGGAAWRWCYSNAPYAPVSTGNPVNPSAPMPANAPAAALPGAPTGTAAPSTGQPPAARPPGT